ncbi:MAG: FAD-dependent oxidoreductase, partial [Gammaproteobacteria bacterium]|nr:FAD-dependent oxidoreductase [Gammaproteobacteria bacterium]
MKGFTDRNQLLAKMRDGQCSDWDIIIVGGGITGAGVLREATRRGYKALLLEQQDFSWGTSSRSSKMVHGGLRYLAAGDLKLTKESVEERERLLNEAPGLVDRIAFYFTF